MKRKSSKEPIKTVNLAAKALSDRRYLPKIALGKKDLYNRQKFKKSED